MWIKKYLKLLILILLILTIPVALYLNTKPKIFKSKADSSAFRVGVNAEGIIDYGYNDTRPYASSDQVDAYLKEIQRMNGSLVRVFVSDKFASNEETARRLSVFIDKAAPYGIQVIPSLIDLYNTPFHPQGLDQYYGGNGRLSDDFFASGYQQGFKNYVQTVVSSNRNKTNIYAWEIGNELKDDDSPDNFKNFMIDISSFIKQLDPNHPISTGMINSAHAYFSDRDAFYSALPNIDIISVHSYDGDHNGQSDIDWARSHGKLSYVGELGSADPANRQDFYQREVNFWKAEGANAVLPWGFIPKGLSDNGDGDTRAGFDAIWHHDYDAIFNILSSAASPLPSNPSSSPSSSPSPSSNSTNKLKIVFVSDKNYLINNPNESAAKTIFNEDAKKLKNFLLRFEPYKSRSNDLTFNTFWNKDDLGCKRTFGIDSPNWRNISCNEDLVKQKVQNANISFDKIYVITDDFFGGSGGINGVGVGYNGRHTNPLDQSGEDLSGYVFVHEFGGHTVAGLLDEYVYSSSNIDNNDPGLGNGPEDGVVEKNCYHGNGQGKPTSPVWPGTSPSDYQLGCQRPNWWRSAAESVMKSYEPGKRDSFSPAAQIVINQTLDNFTHNQSPSPSACKITPDTTLSDACSNCLVSSQPKLKDAYNYFGLTSCSNKQIVTNWCSEFNPTLCSNLKTTTCAASCRL